MFSKILVKLIDQSIVPAILLLSSRIISVILVGEYLNINYTIGSTGFEYASQNEYVLVNSYSTFFMIVVLAVGLFYILLKSFLFHDSHITPGLTAKVFTLRLSSFIQSSFDLYAQGSIWLSYLYLLMMVSGIMAIFGLLYPWVFTIALVLSVISTVLLIIDVEHELHIEKSLIDAAEYDDDFVLDFGSDE